MSDNWAREYLEEHKRKRQEKARKEQEEQDRRLLAQASRARRFDSITDLLIYHGFVIDGEYFRNRSFDIHVSLLAGHTVESFATLAKEKGWIEEEQHHKERPGSLFSAVLAGAKSWRPSSLASFSSSSTLLAGRESPVHELPCRWDEEVKGEEPQGDPQTDGPITSLFTFDHSKDLPLQPSEEIETGGGPWYELGKTESITFYHDHLPEEKQKRIIPNLQVRGVVSAPLLPGCILSEDPPDLWPTQHTGLKEVSFNSEVIPLPGRVVDLPLKKTVTCTFVWNFRDGPCPYKIGQQQVRTIVNPILGESRTYTGLVTQVVENFDMCTVEWWFYGEEVES